MDNLNRHKQVELGLRAAGEYLGCSRQTMWNICKRGEITYRRVGSLIKISMLDLDLYRAEHTVEKVAQ